MQRLIKIRIGNDWDIDNFNRNYLDQNWNIIETIKFDDGNILILTIQKDTRKEKLENIENLST